MTRSPPAYSAVNPTIRVLGNGHGWLPKYRMFSTSIPASSRISRWTHSSKVSPASTKPARTLKKTEGKRRAWARRIFPSRTTATMTAGEMRG